MTSTKLKSNFKKKKKTNMEIPVKKGIEQYYAEEMPRIIEWLSLERT